MAGGARHDERCPSRVAVDAATRAGGRRNPAAPRRSGALPAPSRHPPPRAIDRLLPAAGSARPGHLRTNGRRPPMSRASSFAVAALFFLIIGTANAGGYRFGVSDQAFYVPAIELAADDTLFPRDRAVFDPQMR